MERRAGAVANLVKTALIAGAQGFVGSHLAYHLTIRNWKVLAGLHSGPVARRGSLADVHSVESLDLESLLNPAGDRDRRNPSLPPVDVCFNLASYGVDYRQQNPERLVADNIHLLLRLVDFCSANQVPRLIHVGSAQEYGDHGAAPLSEDSPLRPITLYGAAKAGATLLGLNYARRLGLPLLILRPFGIYGEGEGSHKLVPQLIQAVLTGKPVKLTPGEQVRDYIHVRDFCVALERATERELPPWRVFNVCSGEGITLRELAEVLLRITGQPTTLFEFGKLPYREDEIMGLVGDPGRFRQVAGWQPGIPLEEGLRISVEWFRKNLQESPRAI
jgi:nucleoside-diphosphate-sugar epimerase